MTSIRDLVRRPSAATLLLMAAALVALVSVGAALWRSSRGGENPSAKDWRIVGWAYAEAGDAQASAAAYRHATDLEPDNAENWSSLGESLQTANTAVVLEATEAFEKALRLNPADPRARYFLAVQKDLRGDHRAAIEDWLALLKDTPSQAPWRADLLRTIDRTATLHKIDVAHRVVEATIANTTALGAIPGPTAEQLAAASSIPPHQQDDMARGMVERLAARLNDNPRDPDGWIRLMRSHMVLGDPDRARQALARGLAAFKGDPATQGRLRSTASQLGVREE
jgi:cytochrome c-type biogenesis protein CcmH